MYNKGVTKTSEKYEKEIEELNASHAIKLEETYEEGLLQGIDQTKAVVNKSLKKLDWEYYLSVRHSDVLLDASVQQLLNKFDHDPVAFRKKYGFNPIRASGIVIDVSTELDDSGDEYFLVHLADAEDSSSILECNISTLYEDDVINSQKKSKVITVEGNVFCDQPFDDMDSPTSFSLISGRVTLL